MKKHILMIALGLSVGLLTTIYLAESIRPKNNNSEKELLTTDTVQLASLGTYQTSSKEYRTKYSSPDIYKLLPTQSLVDLNRQNTVFVNCSIDSPSASGFILDIRSYLRDRPSNLFNSSEREKYTKNCSSKIILTAAHVVNKFDEAGECGVYHEDRDTGYGSTKSAADVFINENYSNSSSQILKNSHDYSFIKIDDSIKSERDFSEGLTVCRKSEISRSTCAKGANNIYLSQSYGADIDNLVLSDRCCVDLKKSNPSIEIAHKCHSEGGASGGPLISVDSKTSCVLGIHTAASKASLHNFAISLHKQSLQNDLDNFIRSRCNEPDVDR